MYKKCLVSILLIFLWFSITAIGAPTYVNLGPASLIDGDIGVPDGSGYYIGDVLFSTLGLIDISTLAKTDGGIIVGDGTNFVLETGDTARASLGLTIGTNVQAYDAGLSSLAALTYVSPSFIKVTATDTYAIRTIAEVITDLALDSDDLSDVASIAMLDENEAVTGAWDFDSRLLISYASDDYAPDILFKRSRDGDPTSNVAEDDSIGEFSFRGYHTSAYVQGAIIQAVVDGTPGDYDMPGRLEFWTTRDGYDYSNLRMAIDNAGNIKMGDGAWVNYVNVSAAGAMTFEGTASIDISSDDLSDVATIAMLDEEETITELWTFLGVHQDAISDTANPFLSFRRRRDGDPTSNVSDNDSLGKIDFHGYHTDGYNEGAEIRVAVDGTPGNDDLPTRMEFLTSPDGTKVPVLRMAIDNAGNIKMGDGAWTNYVNVSAAGAMTAEGTAGIKATDLVIAGQAAGDILYFNGTNWIRLAIGTAGQILTVNAGGTAPEWQTP